jgi:hypothetical protein
MSAKQAVNLRSIAIISRTGEARSLIVVSGEEGRGMRALQLVVFLGLAACGGETAQAVPDGGGGSSGGRDSQTTDVQAMGNEAGSSQHDAKVLADSSGAGHDADIADAVTDSGFICLLRASGMWNCGGEDYVPCPAGVEQQGGTCAIDGGQDICVACTTNGTGEQWLCSGTWSVGSPLTCNY